MAGISVCTAAPLSDEWLKERDNGIGASEVAAMLGLNPWQSPIDLWLTKTGQAEGFSGNYASRRGQHMEAFVLAAYAEQHPGAIIDTAPADIPSIIAHPDVPEARCSLDALAHTKDESVVVEIKTGNHRQRGKWADGAMPDTYLLQCMYQLAITGLDTAHVAADIGGDYEERVVVRDDDLCERLVAAVQEWWTQHVVAGAMPTVDPVRDRDRLADLWVPDPTLPATVVGFDLAAQLRDAKAAAAAAKTDLEVITATVQITMQCATAAVDPDGAAVAKWVGSKGRTTIDTAALTADLPDVAATYMRTGKPGRRFTVNG